VKKNELDRRFLFFARFYVFLLSFRFSARLFRPFNVTSASHIALRAAE
jgi:hypothetical protein